MVRIVDSAAELEVGQLQVSGCHADEEGGGETGALPHVFPVSEAVLLRQGN